MSGAVQGRLLVVIAVVAALYFLRAARPVALPLAFALFLVALLWPVQRWLAQRLPSRLAFAATLIGFAACLWAFGWMAAECVDEAVERWPKYQPRFEELSRQWAARAGSWGIQVGGEGGGPEALSWLRRGARAAFTIGGGVLLALALTVLGLREVHPFQEKVSRGLSDVLGGRVLASASRASARFGRYFAARTLMSLIQGVSTGLLAWAVGLDLAFVWGVLSALLNYVPTIGSVIAVVPPALFALVQFEEPTRALLVVGGLSLLQIVLGNYVDPRIQGHWVSLSPFVVLLSISFWGWLWGPAGALIAVPITIGFVILGQEFPSLRPVAVLLSSKEEEEAPKG